MASLQLLPFPTGGLKWSLGVDPDPKKKVDTMKELPGSYGVDHIMIRVPSAPIEAVTEYLKSTSAAFCDGLSEALDPDDRNLDRG